MGSFTSGLRALRAAKNRTHPEHRLAEPDTTPSDHRLDATSEDGVAAIDREHLAGITHEASSATKKSTPFAMSSGVAQPPRRDPLEQRALPLRRRSSPTALMLVGFESTKPGAMLLTVIPNGPSSCAVWRVKPIWPAFALAYAWMPVRLTLRPAPEEMLTMRP